MTRRVFSWLLGWSSFGLIALVLASCEPQSFQVGAGAPAANTAGQAPSGALTAQGADPASEQDLAAQRAVLELISDVPIPNDAELLPARTLVLGKGKKWTGRLQLSLRISLIEARDLYEREMSNFGWQLISSLQEGHGELVFVNEQFSMNLRIESGAISGSIVTITKSLLLN